MTKTMQVCDKVARRSPKTTWTAVPMGEGVSALHESVHVLLPSQVTVELLPSGDLPSLKAHRHRLANPYPVSHK